jgi:hypothetical protein
MLAPITMGIAPVAGRIVCCTKIKFKSHRSKKQAQSLFEPWRDTSPRGFPIFILSDAT